MPPGISSSTVFEPWRYCSIITNCRSAVRAITFTQLAQSITKKSCAAWVRGETFVSDFDGEDAEIPTGREPVFFHGRIMMEFVQAKNIQKRQGTKEV